MQWSTCHVLFLIISVVFLQFEQVINHLDLHPVEDNAMITSESKIRETFIDLIEMFKLATLIQNKLNEQLSIHNDLISTALLDQDYFKAIVIETRLNISDISEDFIKSVNEITNEDIELNDEEIFQNYIIENITKEFLNELNRNKNVYGKDIDLDIVIGKEQAIMSINQIEIFESSEESNETELSDNSTLENVTSVSNRRLNNGKKKKIEDFPFLAAIFVLDKFYCAGAIVSEYLVITAASCLKETWNDKRFRENPSFLTVRVGSSSTSHDGDVIPVTEVNIHPTYDKNTLKGNLCLLKLVTKLKLTSENKSVRKIHYDGSKGHLSKKSGSITILGWGNKKHAVGDPGLVNGILTGVVSVGSTTCGDSNSLTVFTKLGYFSHWIEDIIKTTAAESQKYTQSAATEYPVTETSTQNTEPIEQSTLKSFLRQSKTVVGSNVYKVTNSPDSGLPAPIYISDGVKSILYNNEYNIYLGTENPVGREKVGNSTKTESDESSMEIPISYPQSKNEVLEINKSIEIEITTHTTEVTHKTNKRNKKHKSNAKKSHVTKFTPNLLINMEPLKDDVMNKSLMYMDMLKHDKKHNYKKHRAKHSKYSDPTIDDAKNVHKVHHKTTLSKNMKHVFQDLHEFLKSATAKKPMKTTKVYVHRNTAPISGLSLEETATENDYGLPVPTTLRNFEMIERAKKMSINRDFHRIKIDKPLKVNNEITVLNLRRSTATHNTPKRSSPKEQTDNDDVANPDKHINQHDKANYDYIDSNDVAEDNEFKTEELLNDYLQKAAPKPHSDSASYEEINKSTEDKILNRIYELTSELRKSKPHPTNTNISYRKSNWNAVSPVTVYRIANNLNIFERTTPHDIVLSQDYIYSLIENTINEVEKELQNNDSLIITTNTPIVHV